MPQHRARVGLRALENVQRRLTDLGSALHVALHGGLAATRLGGGVGGEAAGRFSFPKLGKLRFLNLGRLWPIFACRPVYRLRVQRLIRGLAAGGAGTIGTPLVASLVLPGGETAQGDPAPCAPSLRR